jgi:hypothetical protein
MFGILAICGDLGCSTGPWIAGILSNRIQETGESLPLLTNRGFDLEQLGLRSGLLACTIFPVLMLLGLLAFRKKSFKTGL